MHDLSLESYKLILAGSLVFFLFMIKLVVNRGAGKVEIIQAIIELPVSLFSLSLSLLMALIIAAKFTNEALPLICFMFISFPVALLLISIWRHSQTLFAEKKYGWVIFYAILNFLISTFALYNASSELIDSSQPKTNKEVKISQEQKKQ